MYNNKHYLALIAVFFLQVNAYAETKEIALTIDDLPFVGSAVYTEGNVQRANDRFQKIMDTFIAQKIPVTGFVIGGAIGRGQWEMLEKFKENGFAIGNHTYTHKSLNSLTAEKYIADVEKADAKLTPVMTSPKFFRYPYLAEGRGAKKQAMYDYLAKHEYTVAPVTIDSKDYLFNAQLYAIPWRQRDQKAESIKKRYLAYIWKQTQTAEDNAKRSGKEYGKQILLVHSNLLNSLFLADVIDMYKKNGYTFISLSDALKQPAIALNDINTSSDKGKNALVVTALVIDKAMHSIVNLYRSKATVISRASD